MLKLLALSALLTGCLTTTTDAEPTDDIVSEAIHARVVRPIDPPDAVCAKLPDDDSACASACDPDALLAFIPPGSCVTFACRLTDGELFRTGGCRPAEAWRPVHPTELAPRTDAAQ